MMGQGVVCWRLEVGCWMMEVGGGRRWQGRWFDSHQFISAFLFIFQVHISYFKNTSGMNSVDSLRKMFDKQHDASSEPFII
jgi:hypothetical protein